MSDAAIAVFLSGILIGTCIGIWFSWNALTAERDRFRRELDKATKELEKWVATHPAKQVAR